MKKTTLASVMAAACLTFSLPKAGAQTAVYTLDSDLSVINITSTSATITGAPISLPGTTVPTLNAQPITADSFEARYSGTITADLTPTTFQILSGSSITALDEDTYAPGPPNPNDDGDDVFIAAGAPASYGVFVEDFFATFIGVGQPDFAFATRGFTLGLEDSSAKTLTNGSFAAASTSVAITGGVADLDAQDNSTASLFLLSLGGSGTAANSAATNGSILLDAQTQVETLTIPVEYAFTLADPNTGLSITTDFAGQIVATRLIPEPSSLLLLALGGTLTAIRRRSIA
ncbi:MAG: PEP-CTERM sorting domain-containing protein [Planctomycetota bacterium]